MFEMDRAIQTCLNSILVLSDVDRQTEGHTIVVENFH